MMRKSIQLESGEKYNRLTVLKLDHIETRHRKNGQVSHIEYYRCKCDCGKEILVQKACLKNNHVQSCGCLNTENHTKHNGKGTRLYRIWAGMKNRCNNPKSEVYNRYGGRGICVCDEWLKDFKNFAEWAKCNGYNDTLTIDRINVNGNYEPCNCRWISRQEQNLNRRNNHLLEYNGEKKTISEWAKIYKLKPSTLQKRISVWGWSIKKALTGS